MANMFYRQSRDNPKAQFAYNAQHNSDDEISSSEKFRRN